MELLGSPVAAVARKFLAFLPAPGGYFGLMFLGVAFALLLIRVFFVDWLGGFVVEVVVAVAPGLFFSSLSPFLFFLLVVAPGLMFLLEQMLLVQAAWEEGTPLLLFLVLLALLLGFSQEDRLSALKGKLRLHSHLLGSMLILC